MAAKEHSFDISAKIDMQAFKDAIVQAEREVATRYDFKGLTADIDYSEKAKTLTLVSASDNKLEALEDIVIGKLLKRGLTSNVLDKQGVEDSSGGNRKTVFKVVDYIEAKEAKKIAAEIKNLKLKVTAQIEGDHIRVKGKQLDDLQKVIRAIRGMEWDAPLVFENMR
ncbi:YajQ family cyclic di-GMP-binding protein [Sulfurimonas diazotrophicus]|uniref:Nucleotide-binding protein WCY31_00600 n=1 Tax=Sulfurimonas diazotrophicus TaxID=3131939 RepID=A0ABZ3HC41_9BACT